MRENSRHAKSISSSVSISGYSGLLRVLDWVFIVCVITLTWNGLPDLFTNSIYFLIIIYSLFIRTKFKQSYYLKNVNPLIIVIFVTTLFAILFGQTKLLKLNELENFAFSSSKFLPDQTTIYSPLMDIIPALKWYLALVTLPYIIQVLKLENTKVLKRAIYAWILGILVNILVQIMQYLGVAKTGLIANPEFNLSSSRFPGLASHPNALAISVCLSVPLVFLNYVSLPKFSRALMLMVMFTSIYITESRAGLIVLTLSILNIVLIEKKSGSLAKGRFLPLIYSLILGICIGIFNLLISSTRLSSGNMSAKASNFERYQLLKYGWNVFLEYPITGAGASLIKVSHNIYLQVLSSIGIIGLLLFLYFFFTLISSKNQKPYLEKLPVILFLIFGLLNNSLSDFYLYFPLGLAFEIAKKDKNGYFTYRY